MFSRIAAFPVWAKALLVFAVLVVPGLSVLLSPLVMILAPISSIVTGLQRKRPA